MLEMMSHDVAISASRYCQYRLWPKRAGIAASMNALKAGISLMRMTRGRLHQSFRIRPRLFVRTLVARDKLRARMISSSCDGVGDHHPVRQNWRSPIRAIS